MSQISKNWSYNAFIKVLLLRYNHNHGTYIYHFYYIVEHEDLIFDYKSSC